MKHLFSTVVTVLTAAFLLISCTGKPLTESSENAEIAKVIDSAIGWFRTKDFAVMYNTFAQDEDYLEVHPDGTVVRGFAEFKKRSEIFRNPDFVYLRHEIKDLKITLSRRGDTAWFFCILNDISTWKGEKTGWLNTRWTGVLEKRDGRWVIVQQHFSFAAE